MSGPVVRIETINVVAELEALAARLRAHENPEGHAAIIAYLRSLTISLSDFRSVAMSKIDDLIAAQQAIAAGVQNVETQVAAVGVALTAEIQEVQTTIAQIQAGNDAALDPVVTSLQGVAARLTALQTSLQTLETDVAGIVPTPT